MFKFKDPTQRNCSSTNDAKEETSKIDHNFINVSKSVDTNTVVPFKSFAVRIKSGYKSYGKYDVLKNLDLNVPQGAM